MYINFTNVLRSNPKQVNAKLSVRFCGEDQGNESTNDA